MSNITILVTIHVVYFLLVCVCCRWCQPDFVGGVLGEWEFRVILCLRWPYLSNSS